MFKKTLFLAVAVIYFAFAKAQTTPQQFPQEPDTVQVKDFEYYFIDGDSVSAMELDEVLLVENLRFSSRYEKIKYRILQRKVKKVWPYAKLAADRLVKLDERLASIKSKRDKRRYGKMVEKYIEEEFTAELKKLSKTEGQILIKLIHRQTGDTAFDLIKRLRNGWSAFWFNNTARIFDISLKEKYNPNLVIEDFYIEDILMNYFIDEKIEEQEAAVTFDYFAGKKRWIEYEKNLPADYDKINLAARAKKRAEYLRKKKRREKKK